MSIRRTAPALQTAVAGSLSLLLVGGCGPASGGDDSLVGQTPQAAPAVALRLAEAPVLLVGVQEGPDEYVLHNVDGAARLSDGSVVVGVRGSNQVRRYDAEGGHLWSQGRFGEGPGEYQGLKLVRGCTSEEAVVVYDIYNRRVTKIDGQGEVVADYPLVFRDQSPYSLRCSPGGRFVMSAWGALQADVAGPHRWTVPVAFADGEGSEIVLLREKVPGQERVQYFEDDQRALNGPRVWGRGIVLGATDAGAWLGTGDDHEIEFIDWEGATVRRIRWNGPDLAVTEQDIEARRESLRAQYREGGNPNWRPAFQRRWDSERELLPSVFPAYSRLLVPRDGGVWVESYRRPGQANREWLIFDDAGAWSGTLSVPARTVVLDAGTEWALVRDTDEVGVQRVAEYGLIPSS